MLWHSSFHIVLFTCMRIMNEVADEPGSQDLTGGAHLNVILIGALAGITILAIIYNYI